MWYPTDGETLSKIYITNNESFKVISHNFRSCLSSLGEYICGDEKLIHYTGNSAFIRLVPSKPDKIGFWFFELVCKLPNGAPFMIYGRFSNSSPAENIKIPVSEVVKEWGTIAKEYAFKNKNVGPVLVFV